MHCRKVFPHLNAYHDGELSEEHTRLLERHLSVCVTCRRELLQIHGVGKVLDGIVVPPVPREFAARVMSEARKRMIAAPEPTPSRPVWRQPLRWFAALSAPMRAAAGAMIFLACLLGFLLSKESSWPGRQQEFTAGTASTNGLEWFSATPPESLGSIYLTYASATPATGERP